MKSKLFFRIFRITLFFLICTIFQTKVFSDDQNPNVWFGPEGIIAPNYNRDTNELNTLTGIGINIDASSYDPDAHMTYGMGHTWIQDHDSLDFRVLYWLNSIHHGFFIGPVFHYQYGNDGDGSGIGLNFGYGFGDQSQISYFHLNAEIGYSDGDFYRSTKAPIYTSIGVSVGAEPLAILLAPIMFFACINGCHIY